MISLLIITKNGCKLTQGDTRVTQASGKLPASYKVGHSEERPGSYVYLKEISLAWRRMMKVVDCAACMLGGQ